MTGPSVYQRGPNLLVRFVWWLFIGWWASGIAVGIAWIALITVIGIPLGIWIINRLPSILTLRPRTRHWSLGEDEAGNAVVVEREASDRVADPRDLVRPDRLVGSRDLDGHRLADPTDRHRHPDRAPDVQPHAVHRLALPILSGLRRTLRR